LEKTIPVTQDPNGDLADDDTDDLEISNGISPTGVADSVVIPAFRENRFEEGLEVSN
jgi:hypothetical protein